MASPTSSSDFQMVSNASTNLEVISEIVEAMNAYGDRTNDANDVSEANDVIEAEEETEANHDFNDVLPLDDRPETPTILSIILN